MASTLDISLPEPLKAFVEAQTEAGHYASPADYIGELVLQDQSRKQSLKTLLLESLDDTKDSLEISDHDWQYGDIVGLVEEHAQKLG